MRECEGWRWGWFILYVKLPLWVSEVNYNVFIISCANVSVRSSFIFVINFLITLVLFCRTDEVIKQLLKLDQLGRGLNRALHSLFLTDATSHSVCWEVVLGGGRSWPATGSPAQRRRSALTSCSPVSWSSASFSLSACADHLATRRAWKGFHTSHYSATPNLTLSV